MNSSDKRVVLLDRFALAGRGYRLVVELRDGTMSLLKVDDAQEESVVGRFDEESLAAIKREHLEYQDDPFIMAYEVLLHHSVEEVVASLAGEAWAIEKAEERASKAETLDRQMGRIIDLWKIPIDGGVQEDCPVRIRERNLIRSDAHRLLSLNFTVPWVARKMANTLYPEMLDHDGDFYDHLSPFHIEREIPFVARQLVESRAGERGILLSRVLTLALVDHIVAGRLTVGEALRRASEATFDQLLGYEPIQVGVASSGD